jgi:predicted chitinase
VRTITPLDVPWDNLYKLLEGADHGSFPIGSNGLWHGGVHLTPGAAPIRCVADGEIVAYRLDKTLTTFEGPVPADTKEEDKPQYSRGFVLVRHEHVTPKGQSIVFYSLYMHLRPVSEDEAKQQDTSESPFIFKRTGWRVSSDLTGGGLPIINADADEQLGVIPFGARFRTHADDQKCKEERYERVIRYGEFIGYALLDDLDITTVKMKSRRSGMTRTGPKLTVLGENKAPTTHEIATGDYYTREPAPDGHWSTKLRLERVAGIPKVTHKSVAKIEKAANHLKPVTKGSEYSTTTGSITAYELNGTDAASIPSGAYLHTVPGEKLPDWTHDKAHTDKAFEYRVVEWFEATLSGAVLIEAATAGKKGKAGSDLDVRTGPRDIAGVLPKDSEYLVLERHEKDDPWLNTVKLHRVSLIDFASTSKVEGYAFLRTPWTTELPTPAGAPATHTVYVWGRNGLNEIAESAIKAQDDAEHVEGKLDSFCVFGLLPATATPASHWSKAARWRRVTYTQPAIQGQDAISRTGGYVFGGPHLVDEGPVDSAAPNGDHKFKLKTWAEVKPLKLSDDKSGTPTPGLPPTLAIRSHDSNGDMRKLWFHQVERIVMPQTRPWDGNYNGIEVHETAAADSVVRGIFGMFSPVAFKDPLDFNWERKGSKTVATIPAGGFKELAGGGFIQVSKTPTEVEKRCEIPLSKLAWDKTVALSVPIPIKRGDVVGYAGSYVHVPSVLHFEIFVKDENFLENPKDDTWGDKIYQVDAAAPFVREDRAIAHHELPARAAFKTIDRAGAYYKIELLELEGWMLEASLSKVDPKAPAAPRTIATETHELAAKVNTKKDKDGTEHVTLSEEKGKGIPIPGRVGDPISILETKGDCVKIRALVGTVTGGWVRTTQLDKAHVSKELRAELGTYRYITKGAFEVHDENPDLGSGFHTAEGDAKKALDTRVAALPVSAKSKKIELKTAQLRRVKGYELKKDKDGKYQKNGEAADWVGLDGGDTWVRATAVKPVSVPYAWRDWEIVEEKGKYSKDAHCDVDSVLALQKSDVKADDIRKLRHFAFKHPTEWSKDINAPTFEHFKETHDDKLAEDYKASLKHFEALQFWNDANIDAPKDPWHFHPIGFLDHIRKLGWVTKADLLAIYPAKFGEASVEDAIDRYLVKLNDALEKYEITSPHLMAHFFSQIGWESAFLTATVEGKPYDYSGVAGNALQSDTARFTGRGLIQLTGRGNYEEQESSLGIDLTSNDAAAVKVGQDLAVESAACFFRNHFGEKLSPFAHATKGDSLETLRAVTKSINGAHNALGERIRLFRKAMRVFKG